MPKFESQFTSAEIEERLGEIPQIKSDIEDLKENGTGTAGGYYVPTVDSTGNLSWSATDSEMPAVATQNIKGKDGTPGKTAYEYAVEGGYTGTEEEFALLLANGKVYIGSDEPTDPNIVIWINPEEEAETPKLSEFENDVGYITAENVPEAPQADWEQNDETAADYVKNRTHWAKEISEVYLEENTFTVDAESGIFIFGEPGEHEQIKADNIYKVTIDGTEYICTPFEVNGLHCIGNPIYGEVGEDNGMPFFIYVEPETGLIGALEAETATVGIFWEYTEYHKLNRGFLEKPFYIPVDDWGQAGTSGNYTINLTGDSTELAFYLLNGIPVYLEHTNESGFTERHLVTSYMPVHAVKLTLNCASDFPLFLFARRYGITIDGKIVVQFNTTD